MYVTHGTEVILFQVDHCWKLRSIVGLQGVHGVAFVPKLNRGFISNGRAERSTVFDLKTGEKLAEIKTGANPDAILYDGFSNRLFSFNGRSADATAVNVENNLVAGTVPLGGKPEFAQSDDAGTIFVNIEDTGEIAAFDSQEPAGPAPLEAGPRRGAQRPGPGPEEPAPVLRLRQQAAGGLQRRQQAPSSPRRPSAPAATASASTPPPGSSSVPTARAP